MYSFLNVIALTLIKLDKPYKIAKSKLEFQLIEKRKIFNKYINENLIVERNIISDQQSKKIFI